MKKMTTSLCGLVCGLALVAAAVPVSAQHHMDRVDAGSRKRDKSPPCNPPHFKPRQPTKDSYVPSFSEFTATITPELDKGTVVVHVNGKVPEVQIKDRLDGGVDVTGKVPPITQPGPVTILVAAHAKTQDCKAQMAYQIFVGEAPAGAKDKPALKPVPPALSF